MQFEDGHLNDPIALRRRAGALQVDEGQWAVEF
jgi:hypothetical protein